MIASFESFIICFSLLIQKVAMRALGFDVKKADVLKILKDYDREATGKITFEDFNEVGVYLSSLCYQCLLGNYEVFVCFQRKKYPELYYEN